MAVLDGTDATDEGEARAPVPIAELEDEVCRLAAQLAAGTARYLVLLAEFDARNGWACDGVHSCAHWMSWRLGVSLSTAREQLRVARALQHLPATVAQFERGALSYSKVRAITRVATPETEADLVQVGLTAPAAHLDRLVRGLITAADTDATEERRVAHRRATGEEPPDPHAAPRYGLTWSWTHDGVLTGSFRFDPEDGATFLALVGSALHEAGRADGEVTGALGARGALGDDDRTTRDSETPRSDDTICSEEATRSGGGAISDETNRSVEAAREHGTGSDDSTTAGADTGGGGPARSGTEIHRWMTPRHVTPDVLRILLEAAREGAASTRGPRRATAELVVHVDAARLAGERAADDRAQGAVADGPGLLLETVRRIGCDAAVRWALDGPGGSTIDQGRRTRRPSRAQLRALQRRDGGCIHPGCGRRAFLHAHHVRHWADGGATDLDNLVLLCGTHHRLLHDGEFDVRALGAQRFQVVDRLGRPIDPAPALEGDAAELVAAHAAVPAGALTPDWFGEPVRASEATGALLSWWANAATGAADANGGRGATGDGADVA